MVLRAGFDYWLYTSTLNLNYSWIVHVLLMLSGFVICNSFNFTCSPERQTLFEFVSSVLIVCTPIRPSNPLATLLYFRQFRPFISFAFDSFDFILVTPIEFAFVRSSSCSIDRSLSTLLSKFISLPLIWNSLPSPLKYRLPRCYVW